MRILFLLLSALFTFNLAAAEPSSEPPLNVGSTVPDWTLEDSQGNTVNYQEDSDGKASLIMFWATTCRYCNSLLPHLEVIYRKYRSKGLRFYAINAFENGDTDPVDFFEKNEYSFTMLRDGDSVAEQFGLKGPPGLYVVGKDKKITYKRPAGVSDVLVIQNVDLKVKQAIAR